MYVNIVTYNCIMQTAQRNQNIQLHGESCDILKTFKIYYSYICLYWN